MPKPQCPPSTGTTGTSGTTTKAGTDSTACPTNSGNDGRPKPPADGKIDVTLKCPQGGDQTIKGTWDGTTGAVSLTTTLTACIDPDKNTHNGTLSINGTFKMTDTGATVDVSQSVDTTVTSDAGVKTSRKCTYTRKGTYDEASRVFNGTETSSCSKDGALHGDGGVVDNLFRHSWRD